MKNTERYYQIPYHIDERLFMNFERYCRYKGKSRSQMLNHMVKLWLDHNKDVPFNRIGAELSYLDVSGELPVDTRIASAGTLERFYVD